VYTSTA